MTPLTTEHHHTVTSKSRQLRDLNSHTQPIQEALNHAQASLNLAMRLMQREYQQRRQQIIAGHDEETL
jgi:hypothetical protein